MTTKMKEFGAYLRGLREEQGKSLTSLARHLGVSVTYASDVERGTRPPLAEARIDKASAFLEVDAFHLRAAKAAHDGSVSLPVRGMVYQRDLLAVRLAQTWSALPDETISRIATALEAP